MLSDVDNQRQKFQCFELLPGKSRKELYRQATNL